MRKTKFEETSPNNAWMVSFSDVVTLLITFFVLIISMSSMDTKSIKESFTYFEDKPGLLGNEKVGDKNFTYFQKRFNITYQEFQKIVLLLEKYKISDIQALKLLKLEKILGKDYKYNIENNDVIFHIKGTKFFNNYDFSLNSNGKTELKKFKELLKTFDDKCFITVYTTDFPVRTTNIKDNLDLSIKRASKIADFFKKDIAPVRIFVAGWGDKKFSKDIIKIVLKNFLFIKKQKEESNG